MESLAVRSLGSGTAFVIALLVTACFNYLSGSLFFPVNPTGEVAMESVYDLVPISALKADISNIFINVDADVTSGFQWNTKQLYLYVAASFESEANPRNEMVIWDRIISGKEHGKFRRMKVPNKYPIEDMYHELRRANITLMLKYRYMPIFGREKELLVAQSSFVLPSEYMEGQA